MCEFIVHHKAWELMEEEDNHLSGWSPLMHLKGISGSPELDGLFRLTSGYAGPPCSILSMPASSVAWSTLSLSKYLSGTKSNSEKKAVQATQTNEPGIGQDQSGGLPQFMNGLCRYGNC